MCIYMYVCIYILLFTKLLNIVDVLNYEKRCFREKIHEDGKGCIRVG